MPLHRLSTGRPVPFGIPFVVLLVLWTATGIVTLLAGATPASLEASRLVPRLPVDLARVAISPSEALARAALDGPPPDARLLTVLERPAYRFGEVTIFADTGEQLAAVERESSPEAFDPGILIKVSDTLHRLSFTAVAGLPAFRIVMVIGIAALLGLVTIAGAASLLKDLPSRTVARTSVVVFAASLVVLWAASGAVITATGAGADSAGVLVPLDSLSGRPVDARALVVVDLQRLVPVTGGRPVHEIEFVRIQDAPFLVVTLESMETVVIAAETMTAKRVPFTIDSIRTRLAVALPNVQIAGIDVLEVSDGHYMPESGGPLPVARVRFDDRDETWIYVDTGRSAVVERTNRMGRVRSWARALHQLDWRRLSRLLQSFEIATP